MEREPKSRSSRHLSKALVNSVNAIAVIHEYVLIHFLDLAVSVFTLEASSCLGMGNAKICHRSIYFSAIGIEI